MIRSRSSGSHVTAVGGANIDIHGSSHEALRSNDSNPGIVRMSAGGVARNVAENLSRLGIDCRLITAVGDDNQGKMLRQVSCDAGVDLQCVHEISAATTSVYLSVLDDNGDLLVGINDMSVIDQLSPELLHTHRDILGRSSLVIIDSNLSDDALGWLTHYLEDTPVFADTVSTAKAMRLIPYLHAIHTLKTNTIEVEALTGLDAESEDQLHVVADELHAKGVERIFVTRGIDGVFYSTVDNRGMQKSGRGRQIHNTGGAGDAFLAGLAYAWLQDWPLTESIEFALAAADITLSDPATCSPALSVAAVSQLMEAQRAS